MEACIGQRKIVYILLLVLIIQFALGTTVMQVSAEGSFSVLSVVTGDTEPTAITDGLTNQTATMGSLTITFTEDVDITTINETNIIIKKSDNTEIKGGYTVNPVDGDNTKCMVEFGVLEWGKTYVVSLTGDIKNAYGDKNLTPDVRAFTVINKVLVDDNFEANAIAPITLPSSATKEYEDGISGNTVMEFTTPSNASKASSLSIDRSITTNPNQAFVYEGYYKFQDLSSGCPFNILKGSSGMEIGNSTPIDSNTERYFRVYDRSLGGSNFRQISTPLRNDKYYGLKTVVYKAGSYYYFDAYYDFNGGTTSVNDTTYNITGFSGYTNISDVDTQDESRWQLFSEGNMMSTTPFANYNIARIYYVANKPASKVHIDNIKMSYVSREAYLWSTSITNNQHIDAGMPSIDITFNDDIDGTTLNDINIELYDVISNNSVSYIGTYDPNTRKYTLDTEEKLLKDGTYSIQFISSNIRNSDGFLLNAINPIGFTTNADFKIVEDFQFTNMMNSASTLTNLTAGTEISVYPKFTVQKNIEGNQDIIVSVCLFDENNSLRKINIQNRTLTESITSINDVGLSNIIPLANWKVKVYVWDSIISRQAISKNVAFIQAQ